MTRPVVLFIDTDRWSCFDQFSAALRRPGYRTVRVTIDNRKMSNFLGWLSYSRLIHLASMDELPRLAESVDLSQVVDVQCTEWAYPDLIAALPSLPLAPEVRESLVWRSENSDKYAVSEKLRAAGITVPETMSGTSDLDAVVARLGLPVMVKGHVGAGGARVRLVETIADAPSAVITCGGAEQTYYEKYEPGVNMRYSSFRANGDTMQEIVYSTHRPLGSLGPAKAVEIEDDADMRDLGRETLKALGGSGFANVEAIRTPDGRTLVIDVNLRVWQSLVTLSAAGCDFIDVYQRVFDGRAVVGAATVAAVAVGSVLNVFPDDAIDAAVSLPIPTALGVLVRGIRQHGRIVGLRYLLGVTAIFARSLLRDRQPSPRS